VKRVAFIGLGRMGQPMAANLARDLPECAELGHQGAKNGVLM